LNSFLCVKKKFSWNVFEGRKIQELRIMRDDKKRKEDGDQRKDLLHHKHEKLRSKKKFLIFSK